MRQETVEMTEVQRSIAPARRNALEAVFGRDRVAIGVVHCLALPGSPAYEGASMDEISDRAMADAVAYAEGGVHGLIVENHGDIPFSKPEDISDETAAVMSVIADRLRREVGLPLGINVLANAALTALAVAKASGARFIRVNEWANAYVANEGLVEGPAARALRYRSWLHARDVAIFADVHVKHGAHAIVADRSIPELTRDVEFFEADAVIVTGQRTGDTAGAAQAAEIRSSTALPLLVGSGVTKENVRALMELVDGVIIGSSLKKDGVWWNPVERERVVGFMQEFA
jgi:membrane complex biogenesis BtpA family protein